MPKLDLLKTTVLFFSLFTALITPSIANQPKDEPSQTAPEPFVHSLVSILKESGQVKISTTICHTHYFKPVNVNKFVGILNLMDRDNHILTSLHLRTKGYPRHFHPGTHSKCVVVTSKTSFSPKYIRFIKSARLKPTLSTAQQNKTIENNTLKLEFLP